MARKAPHGLKKWRYVDSMRASSALGENYAPLENLCRRSVRHRTLLGRSPRSGSAHHGPSVPYLSVNRLHQQVDSLGARASEKRERLRA